MDGPEVEPDNTDIQMDDPVPLDPVPPPKPKKLRTRKPLPLPAEHVQRIRKLPARYIVNHTGVSDEGGNSNPLLDPLSHVLNSDDELEIECVESDLPSLIQCFIQTETTYANAALTEPIDDPNEKDPETIQQAQSSVYWSYWLAAIYEELESLKQKGVYEEIEDLPQGRKAVGSKWVLHIKRNEDGLIARFKARLVAKGFTQIPGQDFTYTFAPVARWESMRTILTLAGEHDMVLRQVDVKTAYLNGPLDEEIYMKKPSIAGSGYWRLRKGLYGLKQSGRQWYKELNAKLETLGFRRTESDWSVYVRRVDNERSYITTSVDDMLIASSSVSESDAVIEALSSLFEITNNGEPSFHLGCSITRNRETRTLKIDQHAYIESILREFGFEKCNPVHTPMDPGKRLSPETTPLTPAQQEAVNKFPYGALVGKCMYLATCSRPDISYTVRELAGYMVNYGPSHIAAAKHLLRYLKGTQSNGLTLGSTNAVHPTIRALSDSDWGMGDSRKSVSGFVIMMGESPISWSSKQQNVVALSSCEAEYLASTHCTREILWFRNLLAKLGFPQQSATTLFCDNQGTIACTHDPHTHSKMKHIAIREHFIRDCIAKRQIDVIYISNKENFADLFTKPLHRTLLHDGFRCFASTPVKGGVSAVNDRASDN